MRAGSASGAGDTSPPSSYSFLMRLQSSCEAMVKLPRNSRSSKEEPGPISATIRPPMDCLPRRVSVDGRPPTRRCQQIPETRAVGTGHLRIAGIRNGSEDGHHHDYDTAEPLAWTA